MTTTIEIETIETDTEATRAAFRRLTYQTEFLRRRQDNGRQTRLTLLSQIATGLSEFSEACDLPGGYTDPDDPFACDAVGIARSEFDELRRGDYPVPGGEAVMPNGKRMAGGPL